MKRVKKLFFPALAALILSLGFTACGTSYWGASDDAYYDNYYDYNPVWAPDYYMGTRYYYFPDIETYYDLYTQSFVYLQNGRWLFVQTLPAIYSRFNLRDAFIVIVDRNVYDPWMHHQFYNSHYPRYYYIDYYDYSNIPYVRAYNENVRRAVYWKDSERNRAREWGDRSIREGRNFKYSTDDRRVQQEVTRRVSQRAATTPNRTATAPQRATQRTTEAPTRQTAPVRQAAPATERTRSSRSEETNYYGGSIGQPVRVERQMRESSGERRSSGTRSSSTTSTRSSENETPTRSSDNRR